MLPQGVLRGARPARPHLRAAPGHHQSQLHRCIAQVFSLRRSSVRPCLPFRYPVGASICHPCAIARLPTHRAPALDRQDLSGPGVQATCCSCFKYRNAVKPTALPVSLPMRKCRKMQVSTTVGGGSLIARSNPSQGQARLRQFPPQSGSSAARPSVCPNVMIWKVTHHETEQHRICVTQVEISSKKQGDIIEQREGDAKATINIA